MGQNNKYRKLSRYPIFSFNTLIKIFYEINYKLGTLSSHITYITNGENTLLKGVIYTVSCLSNKYSLVPVTLKISYTERKHERTLSQTKRLEILRGHKHKKLIGKNMKNIPNVPYMCWDKSFSHLVGTSHCISL